MRSLPSSPVAFINGLACMDALVDGERGIALIFLGLFIFLTVAEYVVLSSRDDLEEAMQDYIKVLGGKVIKGIKK